MIQPVSGIRYNIPSDYNDIKKDLLRLGLMPSGDIKVDKARLYRAQNNQQTKVETEEQSKISKEEEARLQKLEEERKGAEFMAMYNRYHFGI